MPAGEYPAAFPPSAAWPEAPLRIRGLRYRETGAPAEALLLWADGTFQLQIGWEGRPK
jgi:hypothetical protein